MTSTVNANFSDVASKVQPPQGMSLADMLNLARNAQAYQQAQQLNPLALQKAQAELGLAQTQAEKARRTLEPEIKGAQAISQKQITEATAADVDLRNHYANISRGVYGGLLTDPDFRSNDSKKMVEKLANAKKYLEESGVPIHESKMHDQLEELAKTDPAQANQMIRNGIQQAGGNASQFQQLNSPATYVNTGQMQVPIYQSPYQGGGPGNTPAVQNVLPPTTPIVNQQGTPGYLGPTNQQSNVVSGLAPGQIENIKNNVAIANNDWEQTYKDAQSAENQIGILQNIRDLSKKAFTGVGGSRKELLAGIANAVGIPAYELEKANTDVLSKNSAMLALAGGNTDAARALAEVANPSKKMNQKAIDEAVNQVLGGAVMKKKRADFLAQFKNDPNLYQQKALEFKEVADPRLYQEMTPDQVKSLKSSMTPSEKAAMDRKIKLARQLGVL